MTRADKWKQRPVVARYHLLKDELRLALPGYELPPVLKIEFHIAMPASWGRKKKQAMLGQYHQQKPDIDNLIKGFLDAFHVDDAHVAVVHAGKYWAESGSIVLDMS